MDRMLQIGAMYMGGADFTPKQFARAVEDAGFDSVWAGDHLLHYLDGIAMLGCFAACTDRVTIGTNVIILPFRHPSVTAKGILTAAYTAGPGRRTIMGAGVGGDVPSEFALCGADLRTRGRYADEALAVIKQLWTGEPVSFSGHWSSFDGAVMQPKLAEPPRIWVGGRSEGAMRRAVRFGDGYVPYLISPEQLTGRIARVRQLAAEADRSLDGFTFACTTFMLPARSREEAVELATSRGGFRSVGAGNIGRYYVLGTAEDCLDRLREYVQAGAQHIILGCAPGHDRQLENFLGAAKEILPALRSTAASAR